MKIFMWVSPKLKVNDNLLLDHFLKIQTQVNQIVSENSSFLVMSSDRVLVKKSCY